MDTKFDTDWFRDKLADKNLSQRRLAKYLGLDSSAISLTFRGKRDMKLTEAAHIAQLLSVPVDEVLYHAGVMQHSKGAQVSVIGFLESDGEVRCVSGSDESFSIPAPFGVVGDDYIAIQGRTLGSDIEYMDGWLFFAKVPSRLNPDALGKMSFIQMRNGMRFIAHIRRGYKPDRYNLSGPISGNDMEIMAAQPIEFIKT